MRSFSKLIFLKIKVDVKKKKIRRKKIRKKKKSGEKKYKYAKR